MMKRIVAALFLLLIVLAALVLVAPNFIDWNKHKDTLAVHASAYAQRDVKIGGDISFRLLPNPQLSVADVTVASVDGATQPHFLKLRQLEAKVRLRPLLEGRIEVEKIHLVGPELTLEVLDDARASWQGLAQGDAARKPFVFGQSGGAVKLEDVTLQDGRIRYLHAASGVDAGFDKLNFSIAAPSLRGPYKIIGDMRFRDVPVNVEITTGAPVAGSLGMALSALFQPLDKLPQLSFKGTIGSDSGGAFFDGNLSMEQGAPAALFEQVFLTSPAFLNEEMRLTAEVSLRAGEVSLRDIAGEAVKIKNGRLGGSVTLRRPPMETPLLEADISLSRLPLGIVKGQENLPLPQGLRAKISLRAEETTWRGMNLRKVSLKAESAQDVWTLGELKADLAGKTSLTLRGSSNPAQQTDSLRLTLQSDDPGAGGKRPAAGLAEALAKILPLLPAQRVTLEGNLDLRPGRASLYNFNAAFADGGKVSGVLNLPEKGMEAKLNIDGFSLPDMEAAQREALARQVFAPHVDLDVTAENQKFSGMTLQKILLKSASDDKGTTVETFSGMIGTEGRFALQGHFSSWPPEKADSAKLDYEVKTNDAATLGKALGFVWPLPLHTAAPIDLRGSWSSANIYTIAGGFYGGAVDLQKTAATAPVKLSLSLPDSHGVLSLFGLGIDRLVSPAGPVQLSAEMAGNAEAFTLETLRLAVKDSVTTGRVEKKEAGIQADLRSDTAHFDRWLAADLRQTVPLSLRLRAEKAVARGLTLDKLDSDITVTSDTVEIKSLKAGLWDGTVTARAKLLRRDDKTWTAEAEGDIAALRPMQIPHGLAGLAADEADISFKLAAKAQDKAAFKDVAGEFSLSLPHLTVAGFDPAALGEYLAGLKGVPQDVAATAHKILRGGATTYRDVHADFTREGNVITAKNIALQNAASSLKVEATLDTETSKYDLKTFMTLKNVEGLAPLVLTRAGDVVSAPDYRLQAKQITDYAASRLPPPEPEPVPVVEVLPEATPMLEDNAEMLPPGYLSVPQQGTVLPADETGEDMLREILPVEAETLAAPETEAEPTDEPTALPEEGQSEESTIRGILERLESE